MRKLKLTDVTQRGTKPQVESQEELILSKLLMTLSENNPLTFN